MRKSFIARQRAAAARFAQAEADRAELVRLCGLDSPWLARALLRMVRALRVTQNTLMTEETKWQRLYWQLIPELAWRLGHPVVRIGERSDFMIPTLSDQALRDLTIETWRVCVASKDCPTEHLFFRDEIAGNPLIIALDRLCPPPHDDDPLAKTLRRTATRRGNPCRPAGTKRFSHY